MRCIWCNLPIRWWQRSKPNLTGGFPSIREHRGCQEERRAGLDGTELYLLSRLASHRVLRDHPPEES
jgi:hypothetical protein